MVGAIAIEGGTIGHRTHRLAAFLAIGAFALFGVVLGGIFAWAFPAPEILDDGEQSRFRRARAQIVSGIVVVVLGVVSAVIYATIA